MALETLPSGSMREVMVGATSLTLARWGEVVAAVEALCPHLGGSLADGTLDGPRLRCPLHGATFDARTGEVLEDPFGLVPPEGGVDPLTVYPTRVAAGMIEVDVP